MPSSYLLCFLTPRMLFARHVRNCCHSKVTERERKREREISERKRKIERQEGEREREREREREIYIYIERERETERQREERERERRTKHFIWDCVFFVRRVPDTCVHSGSRPLSGFLQESSATCCSYWSLWQKYHSKPMKPTCSRHFPWW